MAPSLIAGMTFAILIGLPLIYLRETSLFGALVVIAALGVVGGIAMFDLRTRLAPNAITYPAIVGFTICAWALSARSGLDALAGGALMFGIFLVIALLGRGKMGFGDVKMAAVCGAIVGVRGAMPLLLVTFLAGGLVAAFMMVILRRQRQDTVAFTPFLAVGVVVCLAVFDVYLVA